MIDDDHVSLPPEVRAGLALARDRDRRRTGGRLRVQVGEDWFALRGMDSDGFEVDRDAVPRLRGLVEIHDGPRLLHLALIVAEEARGDVIRYAFKRVSSVRDAAPLDYPRDRPVPAGYLPAT